MKVGLSGALFVCLTTLGFPLLVWSKDLGPGFTKVKDGIYTFAPDATTTTCSFVITQDGVVVIDSCNNPLDSRRLLAAIKKLTDKPAGTYPVISVTGGQTADAEPCAALTPHGYFGKESETIEQIVNWMLKKPMLRQVK